jgi:hypothetical protein
MPVAADAASHAALELKRFYPPLCDNSMKHRRFSFVCFAG